MKNQKRQQNPEITETGSINYQNLPSYHTDMATEREFFSTENVEKKSYSFPVDNPMILAGENIIFDPTPLQYIKEEQDENYMHLD
jgi:hypothetical protein